MPRIDIACSACGQTSEVYRPLSQWPAVPPCPSCGGSAEQAFLPRSLPSHAPAVVVYRMPDGTYRFPGSPDGVSCKAYEKQGGTREEYTGWADVRRLEKTVNAQEAEKIHRAIERRQQAHEEAVRLRRSDFHHNLHAGFQVPDGKGGLKVIHLGPKARDLARVVMARNDQKPGPRYQEPGFRVEAFSEDRSNREPGVGSDGKRFRD